MISTTIPQQLNFIAKGNLKGKPLIVTHGWATDSSFTLPIVDLFSTRKVMLLDLPGYGINSHFANINPYSEEFLAKLHDSLPPHCDILSWSLSSLLAIALCAYDKRQKIDKLITICGTPRFPADPNWPGFPGHFVLQTKKLFTKERFQKMLRLFYALQCKSAFNSPENNAFIKDAAKKMIVPNFEVLDRGLKSMSDIDLRVCLKNLPQPCFHLFGEHDNLVPAKQAEYLKRFKHQTFVFKNSGHMPFLTEKELFKQIVLRFLNEEK